MIKKIGLLLLGVSCFLSACTNKKETLNLKWATMNIRLDNPADSMDNWKYRKDTVAQFIKEQGLDIVGMQEVLHNQLTDLKERLPEYTEVGVGREDGATKGEYTPIFFKKDKFEVLDSNTFWLSQYPDSAGFIGWDGACPRIATWVKLKYKKTGKVFMAINTHFDHVGGEARNKGALLIIDRIKELPGNEPAVLTGDFNVNNKSDAYNTLTKNTFVLKDAFQIADKKSGVDYTYHSFGRREKSQREMIDFIFVTPQIKVNSVLIPEEPTRGTGVTFLSDHNPQIAEIEL